MSPRPKLLVVDDRDRYIELAHALLRDYDYATRCELPGPCWECERRPGCRLTHAHDAAEADEALARHSDVDVVLLDVAFDIPEERLLASDEPDIERRRRLQGLAILERLRKRRGELPVVLMTSLEELALERGDKGLAADEMLTLAGADAFDARALGLLVERILARRHEVPEAGGYAWGASPAMARLRREALALARTSLPMLLVGETGTGKSALAEHVLHPASERKGPFVAVDLAALPETIVAAELFGTARGAFSGAVERDGLFAEANGGTLLLDEIGNLPPEAQRMLLLVLQNGRVTRLGETRPRTVEVKVIAATNADLEAAVRAGHFRADLYARLNPAARLELPPLRSRLDDLETLLAGFVRKAFASGPDRALLARYLAEAELGGAPAAHLVIGKESAATERASEPGVAFVLSRASLSALRAHPWPGNVRELELFAKNATVFALADALAAAEQGRAEAGAARTIPIPATLVRDLLDRSWTPATASGAGQSGDGDALHVEPRPSLHDIARDLERRLYIRLFRSTGGDFTAMAKILLDGDPRSNARKVRLRFNQLGLKVKELR
jgi:two-component system nitrogen regulation response regulator GlnG